VAAPVPGAAGVVHPSAECFLTRRPTRGGPPASRRYV